MESHRHLMEISLRRSAAALRMTMLRIRRRLRSCVQSRIEEETAL